MPNFLAIAVFATALALPMLSPGFAPPAQQLQPPSDAELQARADKLIANQHRNEQFLDEYERIERQVDQTAGMAPKVLEDRTYRIVPTGTGTMKILVSAGRAACSLPGPWHFSQPTFHSTTCFVCTL